MKKTLKIKKGSFGKKEIFIQSELINSSHHFLFFHGCCSSPFDKTPTLTELIANEIIEQKLGNVHYYESSRNLRKVELITELSFDEFCTQGFDGKTLDQEIDDASTFVETVIEIINAERQLRPTITLIGFSLGGLLALLMSESIKTDNIFMFGSAYEFEIEQNRPILGQGIKGIIREKINLAASKYSGVITIIRGSEDDTSMKSEVIRLFDLFYNSEAKSLIELDGVDHRFRTRYKQTDPEILKEMIAIITKQLNKKSKDASLHQIITTT